MLRKGQRLGVIIGLVCGFTAVHAMAQEYCVACTGPDAVYRCTIDGARPGGAQPLQVMCITAMAKAGGHASCSVRGGTVFDCKGPLKHVPWVPATGEAPAPRAEAKPADPNEPPKTVLEMAERANKKAAEDLKKAGENMKDGAKSAGDNTKKSWECVFSLFTKC